MPTVGLIDDKKTCPLCSLHMRLAIARKRWRCCRQKRHANGKETSIGLLTNSLFNEVKIKITSAVRLLLAWWLWLPHANTAELIGVSVDTVHYWYACCRSTCSKELLKAEFKIVGVDKVVEIDETSLAKKQKYRRGWR
ncbi:hypothetical protein DVH05_006049 [Phytophthora capsici]|nr:hypothetical protein DVH05_006049 [Phytophthora capsici]